MYKRLANICILVDSSHACMNLLEIYIFEFRYGGNDQIEYYSTSPISVLISLREKFGMAFFEIKVLIYVMFAHKKSKYVQSSSIF